jgi:flagellar hook assembly protein FlgD
VYDLNGRQVDVITSGMKAAGKHTFRWNAAARASGVYMLRLEANGQLLTRKMTLLK